MTSLAGVQHNFFIELENKPAGRSLEGLRLDSDARFDRPRAKRSTANQVMRRKGIEPNGWNIEAVQFDEIGPTAVLAKRLYSQRERIQLPGTTHQDWMLDARRSKLYRAATGQDATEAFPQTGPLIPSIEEASLYTASGRPTASRPWI